MCRLAAYIGGEPVQLSALLYDPPNSLQHAAWAAREQIHGSVNVDGTGVAWWQPHSEVPVRYVTGATPWADPNLSDLAKNLSGNPVLAAVRSATPGLGFGPEHVAPFVAGGLAGVHNGRISGFQTGLGRELIARLSDESFGRLSVMNDSLALFLLVADHCTEGLTLDEAVTAVIADVAKLVVAAGEKATLNLVIAARDQLVAARTSVADVVNSLYLKGTETGSWLASEPLDSEPGWVTLPQHSITVLSGGAFQTRPLPHVGTT